MIHVRLKYSTDQNISSQQTATKHVDDKGYLDFRCKSGELKARNETGCALADFSEMRNYNLGLRAIATKFLIPGSFSVAGFSQRERELQQFASYSISSKFKK